MVLSDIENPRSSMLERKTSAHDDRVAHFSARLHDPCADKFLRIDPENSVRLSYLTLRYPHENGEKRKEMRSERGIGGRVS